MNSQKLYEDFTTKLLPSIQEGLVITKEYFTDLFGRYVKYLIISDTFAVLVGVAGIVLAYKFFKHAMSVWKGSENNYDRFVEGLLVAGASFSVFFAVCVTWMNVDSLIKDIYIPEVRVYEQLRPRMNN